MNIKSIFEITNILLGKEKGTPSKCNFYTILRAQLGSQLEIVIDHHAIHWLHNFKDPDGLTARWLEKLIAFDYEVQHQPGQSIGHSDGLSWTPIVNQITTSYNKQGVDKFKRMKSFEPVYKNGSLFDPRDSLADCISSEVKLSPGVARSSKRKFPYTFPENTNSLLCVQQIDDPFIYHLVTKKSIFSKTNIH